MVNASSSLPALTRARASVNSPVGGAEGAAIAPPKGAATVTQATSKSARQRETPDMMRTSKGHCRKKKRVALSCATLVTQHRGSGSGSHWNETLSRFVYCLFAPNAPTMRPSAEYRE